MADRTLELGPAHGTLEVLTFKEGLLSRMGHDLVIGVERFGVTVSIAGDLAEVVVRVEAGSLVVLGPEDLSAKDRDEIRGNIQKDVLATRRHPEVTYRASGVRVPPGSAASARIELAGELELTGTKRPLPLVVTAEREGDDVRFRGEVELVQSQFGIRPYKAPLGVLKVQDRVRIRWSLRTAR